MPLIDVLIPRSFRDNIRRNSLFLEQIGGAILLDPPTSELTEDEILDLIGPTPTRPVLPGPPPPPPSPSILDGINIGSIIEIEKTLLVRRTIPTLTRLSKSFSDAGGTLTEAKYAQEYGVDSFHLLSVIINIVLKEGQDATEIALRTHNFGETNYVFIKSLKISTGGDLFQIPNFIPTSIGGSRVVSSGATGSPALSDLTLQRRWLFPEANVKRIVIEMEQTQPYPERYVMAVFTAGSEDDPLKKVGFLADVSSKELFSEILKEHPEIQESQELSSLIESYLYKIPKLSTFIRYPSDMEIEGLMISKFSLEDGIGEHGLITIPREESNRYRYAVGLSDIFLGKRSFHPVSEMVSIPYSIRSVSEISLESEFFLPPSFPLGDWVEYSITLDGGATWYRINPQNNVPILFPDGFEVPKTLKVNSEDLDIVRTRNASGIYAYVDLDREIGDIRIKIRLLRPEGPEFVGLTPQVYYYRLVVR